MCVCSIAIWNRRKFVVATSIGVWVTNVSFLVRSESFYPLTSNSLIVQVNSVPLQLRPGTGILACLPRNAETSKLGTTSTFVTDIVLLLIMLVGLLRLRVQGVRTLSLGQLLWKQVRWRFFLGVRISVR